MRNNNGRENRGHCCLSELGAPGRNYCGSSHDIARWDRRLEAEALEYAQNFIAKENAMRIHIWISKLQELDLTLLGFPVSGRFDGRMANQARWPFDQYSANLFFTVTGAANHLKLAFTTIQRAIDRREEHGIVRKVSDAKRDRVFCARELLEILEEPAHLKPQLP